MGNVSFCIGPFRTDLSDHVKGERFVLRSINKGITYYYTPVRAACAAKDCQTSSSFASSTNKLLQDTSPETRPLLVFFSWLGAQPGPVAKYRDLYLQRGLGKTLVPWLEGLIKNTVLLYFWLFKSQTADIYKRSIQVFHSTPITAPALFFYSENDALCDPLMMGKIVELWRQRGVAVQSRKWKESTHAAHMRCHPEDYLSALDRFLSSLHKSPLKT
ncbi:uncharacterized protein [Eucyclogobius newberryi]|uniref:uncharacterized protein isoform X2 n=1 Tax=Eucyclogobius newberryi TaxID=166745 RepID=UPI003B5B6283